MRTFDRGPRLPVVGMTVSRDGRYLAAAGAWVVSVWNLETGQAMSLSTKGRGMEPVAFAPNRPVLATATANPILPFSLLDVAQDRDISPPPIPVVTTLPSSRPARVVGVAVVGHTRSLGFSPDGRLLASGGDDEMVWVRETNTGRVIATYDGHLHTPPPVGDDLHRLVAHFGLAEPRVQNSVWSVTFSTDGTRLASAAQDGAVWLWDLPTGGPGRPGGRVLLPRPEAPAWLPAAQVALAIAALVLLARRQDGVEPRRQKPSPGWKQKRDLT